MRFKLVLSPAMSCPPLPGKGSGGEIPMECMLCLWAESGRVDNFPVFIVSPLPSAQNNLHAKMAYLGWHILIPFPSFSGKALTFLYLYLTPCSPQPS